MSNSKNIHFTYVFIILIVTGLLPKAVNALDVEPGLWGHIPVDTHFLGIGYVNTDADISLDPTLELEDVELDLETWVMKYIYSFESFGKTSRIDVTQGYQEGHWKGLLQGAPAETSRYGATDTWIRYAINLYGAPPLQSADYVRYRRRQDTETIIGAALAVRLPTGDYHKDLLINLGGNRFVIRPQLGIEHNRGPWTFEATSEIAFYTDNNEFFDGNRLEQDPLFKIATSAEYTFRPGFRANISYGYDYGGEATVNDVKKDNRQQNEAWAMSISYPLSPTAGVKLAWIQTKTKESTGLDSESLAVAFIISF